jgi:hypothetical protein
MLEMADLLKEKKKYENMMKDKDVKAGDKEKYQKEIDTLQVKAKEILTKMEDYAKTHKSAGVVAYAQF